ncbi:MAG: S9 family peptidase [Lysobacteraceae bacterium]
MKFIASALSAVLLVLPLLVVAQTVKPHDIEDFIREDKFRSVTVSPKGTYIAVTVPVEDKTVLLLLKPGDSQAPTRIDVAGKKTHIVDVVWVNDERLVYSVALKDQLDERPSYTGELFAINADGSKSKQLAGYIRDDAMIVGRAGGQAAKETVAMSIINTLPEDDENVIASVFRSGSDFTTVERVNVYSGTRSRLSQAPVTNANFMTDNTGFARFVIGAKKDQFSKLYYRKSEDDKWELMNDEGASGKVVFPLGFSVDNNLAYLVSQEKSGPEAVLEYDIATGISRVVARDALADPAGRINAIGKRHVIGVYYAGSTPRYEYFAPDSPDAKAHRALQRAFPGQVIIAGSERTAKNEVLIYASGDREPGSYYAMNLDTRKVSPMMYAAEWLDPQRLGTMRDVVVEARDGRKIPALLTLPPGSDGKNLPLVVHPHGGPYLGDVWGYDTNVQVLAAHGYAVMQVNFRGSTGYGREHELAGHKQWGLKMQDDLTDATRWAIAQGIADKDRICIYGASYGGYASLMGVAKEPDLYKCAIGQVGVYDLARMKADDSLGNDYLRRYHERVMNDGDLGPVSPSRIADKIKAPVFLSAGHEDPRVPIEQSEMMEAALKKAGVPVETLYFKTEAHGIYKLEHRREFYAKLLMFLQKHIGGRAPVVATTAK